MYVTTPQKLAAYSKMGVTDFSRIIEYIVSTHSSGTLVRFNTDAFRKYNSSQLTQIKVNVLYFTLVNPNDINSINHGDGINLLYQGVCSVKMSDKPALSDY
jgi:hypothetical protein